MPRVPAVQLDPGRSIGKRETNKLDKLRRIQRAAEELFVTRGYDSATMRDIAARAGVALGTLFLYASNKRDLLFLIANDIMEDAVDAAASLVASDASVTHNVTLIVGVHLHAFGHKPELFRLVLRELTFYSTGTQGRRAVDNRSRLLRLIQQVVNFAVVSAGIKPEADPKLIARVLFSIIQAEIRSWIASESRAVRAGLESAWKSIALIESGIAFRPTALSSFGEEVRLVMSKLAPQSRSPADATTSGT